MTRARRRKEEEVLALEKEKARKATKRGVPFVEEFSQTTTVKQSSIPAREKQL
jgi:hypothetical protein